jgi:hypothetical protein
VILRRTNGGVIVETVTARRGRRGHDAQMFRTRMPSTKDGRPEELARQPECSDMGFGCELSGERQRSVSCRQVSIFFSLHK